MRVRVPVFLSYYLALLSAFVVTPALSAPSAQPPVGAVSAILVDATNGQILWEKNAHERLPMASTTKIMTAILLLEHSKGGDDVVTASKEASETNNSSMHLQPGEKVTVRNLLYGMMIRSANDGCVAAAEHVSGSTDRFVALMNRKAKEIGAKDTHFANSHGLHDRNHYSTAYDLALMAQYAVRFPLFNEIVRARKVTVERSKNSEDVVFFNHSKFLKRYPCADGMKSGYTRQAGKCYVGSATKNDWRLISVVLNSPDVANDTIALMDWGFGNYKPVVLAEKGQVVRSVEVKRGAAAKVGAVAQNLLRAIVPPGEEGKVTSRLELSDLEAPVQHGQRLGKMVAYIDGKEIASVALLARDDVGVGLSYILFPWLRNGLILLIGVLVSARYGATAAKSAGRRRSRLAQEMRRANRRR